MGEAIVAAAGYAMTYMAGQGGLIMMVGKMAVMAAVSYAINKANAPSMSNLDSGITANIKNPTEPRRVLYGKRRIGGVIVHTEVSTEDDAYLHMMIALAGHEVQSISDIQFNGLPLTDFDYAGVEKPKNVLKWSGEEHLQDSFSIVANGITYSGTIAEIITAIIAVDGLTASGRYQDHTGRPTGIAADDEQVDTYTATLTVSGEKLTDTLIVTCTDTDLDSNVANVADTVVYRVNTHLGTTDQVADAAAVNELENWTVDHRLRGVAYLYVRLRFSVRMFPTGIPTVTALVEGKNDIYDPRDSSYSYTANAALCCADYLSSTEFGFGASYVDDVDIDALSDAANSCDEAFDSSLDPRYTCNGIVDTATDPKSNLEKLMSSMRGKCVFSGGKWFFRAGVYQTPTITLDESDLRDGFTVQTKRPKSDQCNAVRGTYLYVSEDDNIYQPTDFPVVTNSTYQTEDGEQIWKDIELSFTSDSCMAQRLAKIELEATRQGITLNYPTSLSAFGLMAGDTVMINNTRMGWAGKTFEVDDWTFAANTDGTLGVDLSLRETAIGVYAWADGEETTVDLAPNTNLLTPFDVDMVSALTIVEEAVMAEDGGMIVNANVAWNAPVSKSLVAHYEIEGRVVDEETWYRETTTDTTYQINGLAAGFTYFIRVRSVNHYGYPSEWLTSSFVADGITDAITAPSGLTVEATIETLTAVWTNTIADRWRRGTELWASETNDRSVATLVDTLLGTRAGYNVPGGTTFYVWVRHVDKNGNLSDYFPASATAGVVGTSLEGGGITPEQQAELDAATGLVEGIAADGIIDQSEKQQWQGTWNGLVAESINIKEQSVTFDYATDATKDLDSPSNTAVFNSWITAGATLLTYMTTTIDFEDTTYGTVLADVGSSRTEFTATWDDYLAKRILLLNAIEVSASQTADWSNVALTTNAPADNATENTGALADKDTIDSTSLIGTDVVTITHLDTTIVDASNHIIADRLTANNITAGTLNASLVNVINLNASSITAGTITGLAFYTSADSNNRMEMFNYASSTEAGIRAFSGGTETLRLQSNGYCKFNDIVQFGGGALIGSAGNVVASSLSAGTTGVIAGGNITSYGSVTIASSLTVGNSGFDVDSSGNITDCGSIAATSLNLGTAGDVTCDNVNVNDLYGGPSHTTYINVWDELKMNTKDISGAGDIGCDDIDCGAITADGVVKLKTYSSLPAVVAGGIIYYNGWLCFSNGVDWFTSAGVQL